LRPGQTIRVEDAIKGLVTRSANDAAVVIAEAIAGDEDDFAEFMTRKARSLGMSKTVYRNASGLPDDEQVTTARDQSTLGRAIQDRFPRYYRYFSTVSFTFRGHSISNHNHLLGTVEGVDGIKTGYTRASGFNLVTSIRRGNRHLVGVVMGGRSGGSRDAVMRNLLAKKLEKASSKRTVAAITERNSANAGVAETEAAIQPAQTVQPQAASALRSAIPPTAAALAQQSPSSPTPGRSPNPRPAPTAPLDRSDPDSLFPARPEPMSRSGKTVQIKAGAAGFGWRRLVYGGRARYHPDGAATSNAIVAKAETESPRLQRRVARRGQVRDRKPKLQGLRVHRSREPRTGGISVLPASSLPPLLLPGAGSTPPRAPVQPIRKAPASRRLLTRDGLFRWVR
jgi:D-alanyl-D-alanine carboxypeptidase